jgi:hypothetical protein
MSRPANLEGDKTRAKAGRLLALQQLLAASPGRGVSDAKWCRRCPPEQDRECGSGRNDALGANAHLDQPEMVAAIRSCNRRRLT